jgi:glutaredoxin
MGRFWDWLRRGRPASSVHVHVILYTRAGCHLCDDARQMLAEQQRRNVFTLDVVDVDADPLLKSRHGERVPVIVIDGKERFHGQVNRALLLRTLRRQDS